MMLLKEILRLVVLVVGCVLVLSTGGAVVAPTISRTEVARRSRS